MVKKRARKPRAARKDNKAADGGGVYDEEFARNVSDDAASSYSLNSDGGSQEAEESKGFARTLSLKIKKSRNIKERKREKALSSSGSEAEMLTDDGSNDPEKIYSEEDVSSTSFTGNRALFSIDSFAADSRWSVAPDKTISTEFEAYDASARSGMAYEIDEVNDSDVYTSESEEEDNGDGGVVPDPVEDHVENTLDKLVDKETHHEETVVEESVAAAPLSPAPSTTAHSANDEAKPKSKNKKVEGGPPSLYTLASLNTHLVKTKKKKKKLKRRGSNISFKSTQSTKSMKSTASATKSKKKPKSKKTLETIESKSSCESDQKVEQIGQVKRKKLKKQKSKKKAMKKKVALSEEGEGKVGDPLPNKKSIFGASDMLKEKIRNSLQSFVAGGEEPPTNSSGSPGTLSSRKSRLSSFFSPSTTSPSTDASRKVAQSPTSPIIHEEEEDSSESVDYVENDDLDDPPTPRPNQNPEDIDVQKIKADAVARIRGFATMMGRINNQKAFLTAFNASSDDDDDGFDEVAPEPKDQQEKHFKNSKNFSIMLTELQKYEAMLEVERTERSEERYEMKMKQESVEQLLNDEAEKNIMLQAQIDELHEKMDQAGEGFQVEDLKTKILMLEAENEMLQQKDERHQETIASLVREAESELKRKASARPIMDRSRSSHDTRLYTDEHDDSADEKDDRGESGFESISSMGARAQGELLQLRSTLNQKNELLEEQANEMTKLRIELETLREERAVTDLRNYVQNLENEKQFFMTEIDKLKNELAASQKREEEVVAKAKAGKGNNDSTAPTDKGGGWFGWGGGIEEEKKDEKTGSLDLSATQPKALEEESRRTASEIMEEGDKSPKRLSDLLDF